MLDAFYSGVTSCVDPDCRKALKVGAHSSIYCSIARLRPVHIQVGVGPTVGPVSGTSTGHPVPA